MNDPAKLIEFIKIKKKQSFEKTKKATPLTRNTTLMDFRASSAQDNAHRMIYVADLPRQTSYLDLSDFYEKNIGPC